MAAPMPPRPSGPGRKMSTMRPPPQRPGASRAQTATPTLAGRASPSEQPKNRTPKRKAALDMSELEAGEETNINVVVRCRGRNDREVRENSGVVVSTDGIKGTKVDLSMGPNALSNKTYSFDKVFSPAADQGIIFDEVVTPILDEVLAGFNCTLFAYGQTGTGKTYTMSGDITNVLPIPDGAGIIPRVLHYLFDKLGEDAAEKSESSVKCSFIELYNEEMRDLLAHDDGAKLKIYDDANKQGRTTTLVQGMEESHIKSASSGIQLLREGSHKRQVAATKCNDLSSRSHTVFAITVYTKRPSETGEDFVCSGKLNLVDLAGSENIQRSGAENKRAAEAGLINKSLLTLGRVINALVEKGSHIPYRESKLTRLLQDSLGGKTKTCIIATLSPAKSNLEETISTLDYAFRAKNIRNKPQVNQLVSKKTLLREFTTEIEKLKSELIATRQRNGVYLTSESYEELTTESESRRILSEEQRDRIGTLEANIRNKVHELFSLTNNFHSLRRDNEQARTTLDGTKDILAKTEMVLAHTRRTLAEETQLRRAHQETEERLAAIGDDLVGALGTTTDHVSRLHSKLKRRSDLQSENRTRWADSQNRVVSVTSSVEQRIELLRDRQEQLMASLAGRVQAFVSDEMQGLQSSQALLKDKVAAFEHSQLEVKAQSSQAKENMNAVLAEVTTLRDDVKQRVGAGLNDLSGAAQRISAGIATELDSFHGQLQDSYVSLGREFKTIFEDLIKRMHDQQAEAERLRHQISQSHVAFTDAGQASQAQLQQAVEQERQAAAADRAALLVKVAGLINESAAAQDTRMSGFVDSASKRIKTSEDEYRVAHQVYGSGMDIWSSNGRALIDSAVKSKESIKSKLKADWMSADEQTARLAETASAVHGETVRIVDGQIAQMDGQLVALDDIVTKVRVETEDHHEAHAASLRRLVDDVEESYRGIGRHLETSYGRTEALGGDMQDRVAALTDTLLELTAKGNIRRPLDDLRQGIAAASIVEYSTTGETPAKMQYSWPTVLPRTEDHDELLERMRGGGGLGVKNKPGDRSTSPTKPPTNRSPTKPRSSPVKLPSSPTKTAVFTDTRPPFPIPPPLPRSASADFASSAPAGLRELDVNAGAAVTTSDVPELEVGLAPLKHGLSHPAAGLASGLESSIGAKGPGKRSGRLTVAGVAVGRENVLQGAGGLHAVAGAGAGLSASVGPGGRRLRSRGSD